MRILVSIDDTDNLESLGTGDLAAAIAANINESGWGKSYEVTRHQLLVHPDIPYTSHNSSMCFTADINESCLASLIDYASDFLARESAPGSDPGLCVVVIDKLNQPELLIDFGRQAKAKVMTKDDAYQLAGQLGIHLSEHGGTGQGVIGALAGAGLRLSGNDGRFKGKLKIKADGNVASVGDILAQTKVDMVKSLDGVVLRDEELVMLGEKVKAVLLDGKSVVLVAPREEADTDGIMWQTCTKQQLRNF